MSEKEAAPKVGDMVKPGEGLTAAQERTIGLLGNASKIASLITIAGTATSIINNVSDNKKAKEMEKQQEKNIKEKDKRIKKAERKQYWEHRSELATSGMVMDMFDAATGHTRYGASKLPGLK